MSVSMSACPTQYRKKCNCLLIGYQSWPLSIAVGSLQLTYHTVQQYVMMFFKWCSGKSWPGSWQERLRPGFSASSGGGAADILALSPVFPCRALSNLSVLPFHTVDALPPPGCHLEIDGRWGQVEVRSPEASRQSSRFWTLQMCAWWHIWPWYSDCWTQPQPVLMGNQ